MIFNEKKLNRRIGHACSKCFERLKERVNLFPPILLPAFAVSGIKTCNNPHAMWFKTGGLPKKGYPRKIADWGGVDVLHPEEAKQPNRPRNFMDFESVHKAIIEILKNPEASHQYMTFEAAQLCNEKEMNRYILHIMLGASAEDYIFIPGENVDELVIKRPQQTFKDKVEFTKAVRDFTEKFFEKVFRKISKLWRTMTRKPEQDPINRPYFAHFYDMRKGEAGGGLSLLNDELKFKSALWRIKKYWEIASRLYAQGDKPRAFYALGHLLHIIQDLHVPAHVHNDPHGPNILFGKPDSLETWVAERTYQSVYRFPRRSNITMWDSGSLIPPKPDSTWNANNINLKLTLFVNNIVKETQRLRSVDVEGTDSGQKTTGKLTNKECLLQANILIPNAISACAQVIVNFLHFVAQPSNLPTEPLG